MNFLLIIDNTNLKGDKMNQILDKNYTSRSKITVEFSKEMQKKSEITEDDLKNEENEIQKLTDKKVEEIDSMLASKEKEIMSI